MGRVSRFPCCTPVFRARNVRAVYTSGAIFVAKILGCRAIKTSALTYCMLLPSPFAINFYLHAIKFLKHCLWRRLLSTQLNCNYGTHVAFTGQSVMIAGNACTQAADVGAHKMHCIRVGSKIKSMLGSRISFVEDRPVVPRNAGYGIVELGSLSSVMPYMRVYDVLVQFSSSWTFSRKRAGLCTLQENELGNQQKATKCQLETEMLPFAVPGSTPEDDGRASREEYKTSNYYNVLSRSKWSACHSESVIWYVYGLLCIVSTGVSNIFENEESEL